MFDPSSQPGTKGGGAVFVAIYCWRIKPGMEDQFREGWRRLSEARYLDRGSLGARLHRNFDGTWFAYAQWPDRKHWERTQGADPGSATEGLQMMRESVENPNDVDLPAFRLVVTDDLLQGAPYAVGMEHLP
jgi:hypothetical protein